jgi:hypothetical protein
VTNKYSLPGRIRLHSGRNEKAEVFSKKKGASKFRCPLRNSEFFSLGVAGGCLVAGKALIAGAVGMVRRSLVHTHYMAHGAGSGHCGYRMG